MEKKLQLLESFNAKGSDGKQYVVHGYEHMAMVDTLSATTNQWEPTGEAEYKLADGRRLQVDRDETMTIPDSGIRLQRMSGD
ncbi:MAG: hypothetical protein ABI564_15080 [Ideonella sp.]